MSNETTTGAPLAATVGERLGGDPHVKEVREQVQHAAEGSGSGGDARPDAGSPPAEAPGRRPRARKAAGRSAEGGGAGGPAQGGGTPGTGEKAAHAARRASFPWGALAIAAIGWAVASSVASGVRSRTRRMSKRVRGLASHLPGR
jgi:hypothetical protein